MIVHEPEEGAQQTPKRIGIIRMMQIGSALSEPHRKRMTKKGSGEMPIFSLPCVANLMSRKMTAKPRMANMIWRASMIIQVGGNHK